MCKHRLKTTHVEANWVTRGQKEFGWYIWATGVFGPD